MTYDGTKFIRDKFNNIAQIIQNFNSGQLRNQRRKRRFFRFFTLYTTIQTHFQNSTNFHTFLKHFLFFSLMFCSFAENHVFYEVFCASQGPKRAPRRLREGPGWRQEGPRWPQESPRLLQNGPETAQDGPQENREWRQEGLRCPQNGPKRTQQGPNDARRQQDTLRVPLDVIAGCF